MRGSGAAQGAQRRFCTLQTRPPSHLTPSAPHAGAASTVRGTDAPQSPAAVGLSSHCAGSAAAPAAAEASVAITGPHHLVRGAPAETLVARGASSNAWGPGGLVGSEDPDMDPVNSRATSAVCARLPIQGLTSSYFAFLLYRGCMLFVMFFGPFRYFYFRVRVRLLGHLLPTLAWGYVQHIFHEISPISFEN